MDPLYFKIGSKEQFLSALKLHEDPTRENGNYFTGIYENEDFLVVWLGKIPATYRTEENEEGDFQVVDTYKPDYYFNMWVKNQKAMTKYYFAGWATRIEPLTPNIVLS